MRVLWKSVLAIVLASILLLVTTIVTGDYSESSALGFPWRFTHKGDLCGDPVTREFAPCPSVFSPLALIGDSVIHLALIGAIMFRKEITAYIRGE